MTDIIFYLDIAILSLLVGLLILHIRSARRMNNAIVLEQVLEIEKRLLTIEKVQDQMLANLSNELSALRNESALNARSAREEANQSFMSFQHSVLSRMTELAGMQKGSAGDIFPQLNNLTRITRAAWRECVKLCKRSLNQFRTITIRSWSRCGLQLTRSPCHAGAAFGGIF